MWFLIIKLMGIFDLKWLRKFPSLIRGIKHTIWLSFDNLQVTLCSWCRCARFCSKLHHTPSLLIPFTSPVNKQLITLISSRFDSQKTPSKLSMESNFLQLRFHIQSHSSLKLTIHSSSLNLIEANRTRIVPSSFLNRAIQVQFQSSESELHSGRNLHQTL